MEPNSKCPSVETGFQNENSALAPAEHSSSLFFCELHLKLETPAPLFPWSKEGGALELDRSGFDSAPTDSDLGHVSSSL